MKEYKLHNTDGKTFFDFRSNPDSRCEGFTLTYCDDGTVVMSGDYGTLCWKRVPQKIEECNKEKAIEDLKEQAESCEFEEDEKYKEALEEIEWLEEYQDQKFWEIINEHLDGYDLWECKLGIRYTDQFKWNFERLKSISEQVLKAVNEGVKDDGGF